MVLNILLPFLNFYDKHSDFQKQFNMYIYNWITLLYNWNNIQSKQTLWDPMDCSPPDSSVHEILWARILEWVAISFRGSSQPRDWTQVSHIAAGLFTNWTTREATKEDICVEVTLKLSCKCAGSHVWRLEKALTRNQEKSKVLEKDITIVSRCSKNSHEERGLHLFYEILEA